MFDLFKWNKISFVLQAAPKAPLFRKTRRDVRLLQFFSKILVYKNTFSRKITQWTLPSRITVSDEDFKTVTAIWVYIQKYVSLFTYSIAQQIFIKRKKKKNFFRTFAVLSILFTDLSPKNTSKLKLPRKLHLKRKNSHEFFVLISTDDRFNWQF